jgi:hypothetical protein
MIQLIASNHLSQIKMKIEPLISSLFLENPYWYGQDKEFK